MAMTRIPSRFDVLIVGAGSAGCVLAARLSENAGVRGGILEAGGPACDPDIAIPQKWPLLAGRNYDWAYRTTPQAATAGRVPECHGPRARGPGRFRCLVRCHRIIALVVRGVAAGVLQNREFLRWRRRPAWRRRPLAGDVARRRVESRGARVHGGWIGGGHPLARRPQHRRAAGRRSEFTHYSRWTTRDGCRRVSGTGPRACQPDRDQ